MSLTFQVIDWCVYQDYKNKKSIIQIFGKTLNGESVMIEVDDYKSCFYTKANKQTINKLCKDNIEVIENVKFKRFYGFHGDEQELFNKVQSNFNITLKKLSDKLLTEGYEVFESNKDIIVQFIHDHNLKSCGWITIDNPKYSSINESYCDISYKVSEKKIKSADSDYDLKMAPFRVCAYDIETISSDDGFPQARRKDDKIVSIACTFNEINKECDTRVVLIVHNEKFKIDKEHKVIICKDEEELINEWMQLIIDEDPDIITSWNGFGFDDNYIHERIMRLSGVIKYDEDINKNVYVDDKIKLDKKSKNDLTCTLLSKENTYKINELFPVYLSRFAHPTNFVIKNLASAALGDSTMRYYDIKGRCVFDLMKVVRRDYKLVSYKLDYVASYMFRDKICKCEYDGNKTIITVDTKDLHNNQYIIIIRNDGASDYECFDEKKFQINIIDKNTLSINEHIELDNSLKGNYYICNVKDDVKPKQIFEKYRSGSIEDLKQLSLYNIQDCELCNKLCNKMFVMINNIGMANVCYVPLNWIFNRGQSPKVYSLVSKKCMEEGYKIRTLKHIDKETEDDFTYEGALVVDPVPGIYNAIFCLDYHALYPSSMICKNISHETYLMGNNDEINELKSKYSDRYDFKCVKYLPLDRKIMTKKEEEKKYKNIDTLKIERKQQVINTNQKEKECWFAVDKSGKLGLLPEILTELLNNRENVKKQMSKESDPFKKKLLNGLQLAYKITCNSVYGQLGCDENIGPIALKDIAACTTATGREMLGLAKHFASVIFPKIIEYSLNDDNNFYSYCNKVLINRVNDYKWFDSFKDSIRSLFLDKNNKRKYLTDFSIAYGDTDSIFVNMDLRYLNGEYVYGNELRDVYIKAGSIASKVVEGLLPHPEKLEYEKVLSPFISMAKKRYVGNFYTNNPNKPDMQYNMGFVLKRRDNARIVKYIIGGIVDKLLNGNNLEISKKECIELLKDNLDKLINGQFNIKMFVFNKTLKREYKNKDGFAHAVLADRIGKRDPGNKPSPNERIDFAYIVNPSAKLQGDRVETPEYILEHKLKIDYSFYIEHQLLKPCCQIISLFDNNIYRLFDEYVDKSKIGNTLKKKDLLSGCNDYDDNEFMDMIKMSRNKTNDKKKR